MIYVTHDQVEAMTMADRIVVMRSGRIEQVGTPLELYDRPANQFVAGFIGSPAMNFLPGTLERNGAAAAFVSAHGARIALAGSATPPPGGDVVFGIRPEHLDLSFTALDDAFSATVAVVEPTGAETLVLARCPDGELTCICKGRPEVRPGQAIWLQPQPQDTHIFPAEG